MPDKPKVGDTLYVRNVGNSARYTPSVLRPAIVIKCGHKYITVKADGINWDLVFHLDTWEEKSDYQPEYELYETTQHYTEAVLIKTLLASIKEDFSRWAGYDLDKLKAIDAIINGDTAS